jgi:hypothetical protein
VTGNLDLVRASPALALAELAHVFFEQRPALDAQLLLPLGIDLGQLRPKWPSFDFVEDEAARAELLAEIRIEVGLLLALLAHVFGGVGLDHLFEVIGESIPGRQMWHQTRALLCLCTTSHIWVRFLCNVPGAA